MDDAPDTSTDSPGSIRPEFGRTQYCETTRDEFDISQPSVAVSCEAEATRSAR